MTNTVFVIGAGASKEANLPTGDELKSRIAQLLDIRFETFAHRLQSGDYSITEALEYYIKQSNGQRIEINEYLHEAWHIRDALPQAISIDNFIDAHRDNDKIALCGKLGIVRSILDAEKNSLLNFNQLEANSTLNFENLSDSWYIPFFQLLTENCGKNDLEQRLRSITLIIFNYDRCIEHYIFHALKNYYKISDPEAAAIISNINIYHPYGDVGTLPWADSNRGVDFGLDLRPERLLEIALGIKTFTEGTDPDSSEIVEIRNKVGQAEKLIFIGFAFHKLNMQLIAPNTIQQGSDFVPRCFATTLGISAHVGFKVKAL